MKYISWIMAALCLGMGILAQIKGNHYMSVALISISILLVKK